MVVKYYVNSVKLIICKRNADEIALLHNKVVYQCPPKLNQHSVV